MKFYVNMIAPSTMKARNASDGHWYVNPAAVEFEEAIKKADGDRRVPDEWTFYNLKITIDRKADRGKLACRLKVTLDSLNHSKVWKDDRYVAKLSLKYGKLGRDRTTIEITEAKRKWS